MKHLRPTLLLGCTILLFLNFSYVQKDAQQPPVEFNLSGKIIDETTEAPVVAAFVELMNDCDKRIKGVLTGVDGSYRFSNLPADCCYYVKVSKEPMYLTQSTDRICTRGQKASKDFKKDVALMKFNNPLYGNEILEETDVVMDIEEEPAMMVKDAVAKDDLASPISRKKRKEREKYSALVEKMDIRVAASDSKGEAKMLMEESSSYDKNLKAGTLTAGEINDFSKWKLWEDIENTDLGGYRKTWNMNLVDRYTIQLMNKEGIPIIDAEVQIFNQDKEVLWTSRSDNTGKAELWLNIFEKQNATKLYAKVSYNGETHKIQRINTFHNGINTLEIDEPCSLVDQVDVMFVVDATGSMSDEINYLKVELKDVIEKMQEKNEDLTINLGSVFYRDKGDAYLTRHTDFSDDINKTVEFIGQQGAGGGGDTPEAVDAALEVALDSLKWSENAVSRLLFLVLDAPPHTDAEALAKLERLTKKAAQKGIRIIPLTASGIDKSTEYLMRSMALSTNGTYVFLTDDSGVGGKHIKPTTDSYKVETLNELLVRLYVQYTQTPVCEGDQPFAMIDDNTNPIDDNVDNNPVEPTENFSFKYYPNPSRGQLTIELETSLDECFITDASGKIIQRHANLQAGKTPVDLSGFPSGIYFIRYMKGKKAETEKLILLK